ncbi:probable E3 ubiquitin-protein ligase HECTD4 [Tigriopus californicus]|nr:probable E3 ubiquitin-protein ligase HECTD4 [Tigriopus californicus]
MKVTSRTLETIINKFNGEGITLRLRLLEKLSMTSLVGSVLSTVVLLSNHEVQSELDSVKHSIQDMVQLNLECRKIAYNLQNQLEDEEKDDEDEIDQDHGAGTFVPCPWDEGRIIESVHPLRENYKVRETFTILGSKHLYLFFDPRCSTQYDYDKVVIYQGKSVNGKKISEFGGNTFGFGSKSVLGCGWPSQAVVIECDSVTVAFEMRSSREQGVPDKALWGFKIHVKTLNIPPGVGPISHFSSLSLSLEYTTFNMLRVLFQGQPITAEEQESEVLLRSRLLQQCTWKAKSPLGSSPTGFDSITDDDLLEQDVHRIPLCSKLMSKLRDLSETRLPPLRPSVKTILRPECLEDAIVSSVIKHLGFQEFIKYFDAHEKDLTQEYYIFCDIISETYMKYHALVRRLQVLAELENQWNTEVDDVREKMTELNKAFFVDYQHHESKSKELALLCFLKGVSTEDGFQNVTERLKLELQKEASNGMAETSVLELTSRIVKGIMERIELLLQVSINIGQDGEDSNGDRPTFMSRSLQNWPKKGSRRGITKQQSVEIERSLDDSILQIPKLKKQVKKIPTARSVIENLAKGKTTQEDDRTPESVVLDQLFAFIGSHPEKAVSAKSFVKAALVRRQRSRCRIQALALMKGILSSSYAIGGTQEIISLSSAILQHGMKVQEITCGSLVTQTEEAFADTLLTLVQLIESQPELYKTDIARLTIIPYSRDEESCLVKCGLLKLLDKLCGYHQTSDDEVDVEMQTAQHRLSEVAWLGFKVLTHRCIDWEDNESSTPPINQGAGLATQISSLLTNHLLKAARGSNNFMNCSVLQEVLTLLSSLVRCQIGRDILSKPKCVSTLLALMLETRLSPKMILSITRLCHIALPLMSSTDCDQVHVPDWFLGNIKVVWPSDSTARDKIVDLLLTKMGDFIVPGVTASLPHHATFSKRSTRLTTKSESKDQPKLEPNPNVELARECNNLSLIIHKREDESAQDIVQKLLNSNHELRLFRPVGNEPMERVVVIDQLLTRSQRAEILTEDATLVLRKATKMAQHGFTVSIEPPDKVDQNPEQRLLHMEETCRDKNRVLLKTSPQRPFVSSQVANTLATEIVSLINSLLLFKKADLWSDTILSGLKRSVERFSDFLNQEALLFTADQNKLLEIFSLGRTILASLSILGSFQETLKEGMDITVVSEHGIHSPGVVQSVNWEHCTAMVLLNVEQPSFQIPLSSVQSQQQVLVETFRPLFPLIIKMSQLLLVPNSLGHDHLSTPLPGSGDDHELRLMTARLVSEIRVSTCAVLAQYTRDEEFSSRFMQESCHAVDMLKCLAKEVGAVDHIEKVQINCSRLRGIYRDCVKPPLLESKPFGKPGLTNHWNVNLAFPPLKSLLFTYGLTGITYHADPGLSSGLPRGNFVYAQYPLNRINAYFEVNIISLGEHHEETTSPMLSIGLAPKAEKKDGGWSNPNGTVLLHNNGRLVHYNGSSLLQWRSLRFELQMSPGDIIGLGWEPSHLDPNSTHTQNWGKLYFTQNGTRLSQELEGVPLGLFPVLHLQKKDTRVRANFGQIEFIHHRLIIEDDQESPQPSMTETDESDDAMPFRRCSADEDTVILAGDHRSNPYSSRPAPKIKILSNMVPESVLSHRLARHGNPQARTGPFQPDFINLDEDSDFEDLYEEDAAGVDSDGGELESRPETANSLLVKAWETRVFPVIRRRFRNEAERRDGLEQIKGALSLGMTDIARQTVEFLYEENGGIPADVHLPTIEDMKEELLKLSIDQIKRGDSVSIRTLTDQSSHHNFYSTSQLKTFGLLGEVLDIDKQEELVLVETYLKSEGILVSFWYPLPYLSKPNKDQKAEGSTFSSSINVSIAKSSLIHRELLSQEFVLSRLWCRSAYLNLHRHAQESDLGEFAPDYPNSSKLSMLTSSTMLLQDVDLENLQIMSNHDSANEPCTNNILEANLMVRSGREILSHQVGSRRGIFLSSEKPLGSEICRILNKIQLNQDQSMEHLLEVVNLVCQCLFHGSDYFVSEEIVINDISTLKSLIHFRDTAFVMVNVKLPSSMGRDHHPDDLQIQIQTMNGSVIRPNGTNSAKNVLQYPVPVNGGDDSHERAFPEVILPTNLVRISQGGGAESGTILHLFGIPLQFPLVLRFIHEMTQLSVEQLGSQPFEEIVLGLCQTLLQLDAPPTFRMIIMDQLAQILQILPDEVPLSTTKLRQINLHLGQELALLEEQDRKGGAVRNSIYFQTSFELLLTVFTKFRDASHGHSKIDSRLEKAYQCLHGSKSGVVSYSPKSSTPNRPLPPAWIFLSPLPTRLEVEVMKSTIHRALTRLGGLRSSGFHWSERDSMRTIILELRFHANINQAVNTLQAIPWICQTFQVNDRTVTPEVSTLNSNYECASQSLQVQRIVDTFLKEKVLDSNRFTSTIHEVFQSTLGLFVKGNTNEGGTSSLTSQQIMQAHPENKVREVIVTLLTDSDLNSVLGKFGSKAQDRDEESLKETAMTRIAPSETESTDELFTLTEKQFTSFVIASAAGKIQAFVVALANCGYDHNLEQMFSQELHQSDSQWTPESDNQLVHWMEDTAQDLDLNPSQIHPQEVHLSPEDHLKSEFSLLHTQSDQELGKHAALILAWNEAVFRDLIPNIPLSCDHSNRQSTAAFLTRHKSKLFFSHKETYLNQILNASCQRGRDQVAPEVSLNPITSIGSTNESLSATWFFQTWQQLRDVSSSQFCVAMPQGSDPEFPFKVKFLGEEVHGSSGSFRQFFTHVAEEIHGAVLCLTLPYLGSGPFKGRYQLRCCPLTWMNEKLLQFWGQLMGIALRAGIPFVLDMVPSFWKALLHEHIAESDLRLMDPNLFHYMADIQDCQDPSNFDTLLEEHQFPRFTFQSNCGLELPLCPNGGNKYLSFKNRAEYCDLLLQFKLSELAASGHICQIRAGLSTVVPIEILHCLYTPNELELRVCGSPKVSVKLLQSHTIYQAGLTVDEEHIQFFWNALESFTDRQLTRFIKFACNQERLPLANVKTITNKFSSEKGKDEDGSTLHIPPFPMMIAPSDKGDVQVEQQNIRVETCMFMLKLPRYPSFDMMRDKLLFAIHAAFDPLSG